MAKPTLENMPFYGVYTLNQESDAPQNWLKNAPERYETLLHDQVEMVGHHGEGRQAHIDAG